MIASLRINDDYLQRLKQYSKDNSLELNHCHTWSTFLLNLNQATIEALSYLLEFNDLNDKNTYRGTLSAMIQKVLPRLYVMPKMLLFDVEVLCTSIPLKIVAEQHLNISIDRLSTLIMDNGDDSSSLSRKDIFSQLNDALQNVDARQLRTSLGRKPISISLVGENDIVDQNRIYCEVFKTLVDEFKNNLSRHHEQLFVLCSNGRNSTGKNRECLIPSSCTHIKKYQLKQRLFQRYKTFGRLMGIGIRSDTPMCLDLAPMIYKGIVRATISWSDVCEIDSCVAELVSRLLEPVTGWEDLFENSKPIWSVPDGSGRNTQIGDNQETSKARSLSVKDLPKYVNAVKEFRMHEFSMQIEAIRQGLYEIVPCSCFTIMTWQDLANRVKGKGRQCNYQRSEY